MIIDVRRADGTVLNAKVELTENAVILHSRGGAFGKPNLRNPDYAEALVEILSRLLASGPKPHTVWLDSGQVQGNPTKDRVLATADDTTVSQTR